MISVVIPCYNEEKRLGASLGKITSYMKSRKHAYEILVVDDGSTDSTVKIAEEHKATVIRNSRNMGKGYSVRNGALRAKGEHILFTDSDLSTPIEELDSFLDLARRYDIVIGSRKERDSKIIEKQNIFRIMAGNLFPIIVRLLLLPGINDSQCGFKLFRKSCVSIFKKQRINGFAFDVEILYIARKSGYSIKEKGVTWVNDKSSKVSLIRDSIRMFIEIMKIRLNSIFGRYD